MATTTVVKKATGQIDGAQSVQKFQAPCFGHVQHPEQQIGQAAVSNVTTAKAPDTVMDMVHSVCHDYQQRGLEKAQLKAFIEEKTKELTRCIQDTDIQIQLTASASGHNESKERQLTRYEIGQREIDEKLHTFLQVDSPQYYSRLQQGEDILLSLEKDIEELRDTEKFLSKELVAAESQIKEVERNINSRVEQLQKCENQMTEKRSTLKEHEEHYCALKQSLQDCINELLGMETDRDTRQDMLDQMHRRATIANGQHWVDHHTLLMTQYDDVRRLAQLAADTNSLAAQLQDSTIKHQALLSDVQNSAQFLQEMKEEFDQSDSNIVSLKGLLYQIKSKEVAQISDSCQRMSSMLQEKKASKHYAEMEVEKYVEYVHILVSFIDSCDKEKYNSVEELKRSMNQFYGMKQQYHSLEQRRKELSELHDNEVLNTTEVIAKLKVDVKQSTDERDLLLCQRHEELKLFEEKSELAVQEQSSVLQLDDTVKSLQEEVTVLQEEHDTLVASLSNEAKLVDELQQLDVLVCTTAQELDGIRQKVHFGSSDIESLQQCIEQLQHQKDESNLCQQYVPTEEELAEIERHVETQLSNEVDNSHETAVAELQDKTSKQSIAHELSLKKQKQAHESELSDLNTQIEKLQTTISTNKHAGKQDLSASVTKNVLPNGGLTKTSMDVPDPSSVDERTYPLNEDVEVDYIHQAVSQSKQPVTHTIVSPPSGGNIVLNTVINTISNSQTNQAVEHSELNHLSQFSATHQVSDNQPLSAQRPFSIVKIMSPSFPHIDNDLASEAGSITPSIAPSEDLFCLDKPIYDRVGSQHERRRNRVTQSSQMKASKVKDSVKAGAAGWQTPDSSLAKLPQPAKVADPFAVGAEVASNTVKKYKADHKRSTVHIEQTTTLKRAEQSVEEMEDRVTPPEDTARKLQSIKQPICTATKQKEIVSTTTGRLGHGYKPVRKIKGANSTAKPLVPTFSQFKENKAKNSATAHPVPMAPKRAAVKSTTVKPKTVAASAGDWFFDD